MSLMSQLRGWAAGLMLTATALFAVGCSRPLAIPADGTLSNASSTLGRSDGTKTGDPGSQETSSAEPGRGENLPFKSHENLPAGTMITVRLKNAISADDAISPDSFEAIVAQPVVVAGSTLIPAGSTVAGHVESAHTSKVKPDRGYVRLT